MKRIGTSFEEVPQANRKGSKAEFKSNNLSLREISVALFRQRRLILATFVTTASVAAFLAWYLPDQYESRMKFLVKNTRVETPVAAEPTGVAFDRNEISENQITSEMELLKSRDLLEQVVRNNRLAVAENGGSPTEQDVERAVYKLEKDLQIAPVKKSNIIEVGYTSKSPEVAAKVLQNLSDLYLEKHLRLHRPPGTYEFFKEQADQYERDLRDAEKRLTNFQQKMDVVSLQQQKELIVTRLTDAESRLHDLNGTIKETDQRIAELQTQLARIAPRVATQSRVIPNQYSVERLNTMLVELKNRRIQLLAKFQPEDRLVKEVDDQIRETTEAYRKAIGSTAVEQASDVNPLRQQLEGELTRARVDQTGRNALRDNLAAQVKRYQNLLAKLEGATVVHEDLSRQVKQADESFQLYSKKEEEARISNELDKQKISNVTLAEAPVVPRVPSKTNRPLTAALGLVFGLFLGVASAIAAEFFRSTVHTPRELEVLTNAPVLATFQMRADDEELLDYRRERAEIGDEFFTEEFREFEPNEFAFDRARTKNQPIYSMN